MDFLPETLSIAKELACLGSPMFLIMALLFYVLIYGF